MVKKAMWLDVKKEMCMVVSDVLHSLYTVQHMFELLAVSCSDGCMQNADSVIQSFFERDLRSFCC